MKAVLRNIGVVGLMLTCACVLARPGSVKNEGRGGAVLSEDDFKKLDTFEGVLLSKADKVFVAKDFRRAAAEYDAFILQYPKSVAVPYALLRKGRSLHSDGKRFDAIKVYNEVLDYFPNAIEYAGSALYLIGECHWENGDVKEAVKSWAEMAKDADYRKLALAAGAINRLADNLVRQEKWPEAVTYYQQVAADFRRSNGEAAGYAMDRVIFYYVRVQPDVTKLRAAYDKFQTFESQPGQGDEVNFWSRTMGAIDRFGAFAETEKSDKNAYYQYWSKAMDGKHPAWDDFQLTLARYQMVYDGDAVKWMNRVDAQYTKFQKVGDYSRTIRWVGLYTGHKGKIDEYYSKLSFDKMTNIQIESLIRLLYDSGNELAMAHNTVGRLKADLMTDDEREKLAMFIGKRDEPAVEMLCYAMKDPDRGKMVLLRYYSGTRQADKGLKLSDALVNVPAYA